MKSPISAISVVCFACLVQIPAFGQQLYWPSNYDEDNCCTGTIESKFADGSRHTILLEGLTGTRHCWIDSEAGFLYWMGSLAGTGGLQRMALDGSNLDVQFSVIRGDTNGWLDLDAAAGKAYVVQDCIYGGDCVISQIDLETGDQIDLASVGSNEATIDLAGGKKYCVKWGCPDFANQSCIRQANIDGTDEILFFAGPTTSGINDLSLDRSAAKLYWRTVDRQHGFLVKNLIQRMNTDGTGLETLISMPFMPDYNPAFAVDFVNQKIYWDNNGEIHRSDFGGANEEDLDISVGAYGLAVRNKPAAVCQVTDKFADIVEPFASGGTVQPDFRDIDAMVNCFRQGAGCDPMMNQLADLYPCWAAPDECIGDGGLIDFADISVALDAFRGFGCR